MHDTGNEKIYLYFFFALFLFFLSTCYFHFKYRRLFFISMRSLSTGKNQQRSWHCRPVAWIPIGKNECAIILFCKNGNGNFHTLTILEAFVA